MMYPIPGTANGWKGNPLLTACQAAGPDVRMACFRAAYAEEETRWLPERGREGAREGCDWPNYLSNAFQDGSNGRDGTIIRTLDQIFLFPHLYTCSMDITGSKSVGSDNCIFRFQCWMFSLVRCERGYFPTLRFYSSERCHDSPRPYFG